MNKTSIRWLEVGSILAVILLPVFSFATDFSSTHFTVKDSVIEPVGGLSTSTNFQLNGSFGQLGTGSSSASVGLRSGFLYYPGIPSTPSSLAATAASASEIDLSWNDNSNNEEGFTIERKTGSGGTYAQIATTTRNVVSYADINLNASTDYVYRIRAFAGDVNSSYSNEADATTNGSGGGNSGGSGSSGGGGGGGGGGSIPQVSPTVTFLGMAYPSSQVTLLKDGAVAAATVAGPDAKFQVSLTGIGSGSYNFSLWAQDYQGNRSSAYTFPVTVTAGAGVVISGIFIQPTISIDKTEVKRGDVLTLLGQTAPAAHVAILIHSDNEIVHAVDSDPKSGAWLYHFDTLEVASGDHSTQARASKDDAYTTFSKVLNFTVGTKNVAAAAPQKTPEQGDINHDGRVNLIDFSVLAYWWHRSLTPDALKMIDPKLRPNGVVDLRSFSIMAYYWTG